MELSSNTEWVVGVSSPGDLSHPVIKPTSLSLPGIAGRFFTTSATREAPYVHKPDPVLWERNQMT